MSEYIFWISISLICYIWIGYYLRRSAMAILAKNETESMKGKKVFPFISVISAAYNE